MPTPFRQLLNRVVRPRPSASARRRAFSPRLEMLEDRQVLSTFPVTTQLDNGNNASPTVGSLRKAILDANQKPGQDFIQFSIGNGGAYTIQPPAALPTITEAVIINGYSQLGSSFNSSANTDNAVLCIALYGKLAVGLVDGLTINANECSIQGLNIQCFSGDGIYVLEAIIRSPAIS